MPSTTDTIASAAKDVASTAKDVASTAQDVKAAAGEATEKATSDLASSLRSLVAGGVGGVCAVLTGHPFDLVKVHMQTAEKGAHKGALDITRKIIARAGPTGLYAGVTAPLYGVTPMFAISFWGYDVGKSLVKRFSVVENNSLSIAQTSAAGFFSAIPMTIITAPMERVKVLLQIQGQHLKPGEAPKYAGSADCAKQLLREGGIRSLYRGTFMTLARDGPGSAAYFAAYEGVKRALTPKDEAGNPTGGLSLTAITVAGATAGVAMWIPVFPVDTIKSRIQSASGSPTIGGVVGQLWKSGGIRAFFPGIGPALARAVPANAATFLGVELAQQAMGKFFD
ncbi:mitochondrial carrier [Trichodelitschia bisporula]|uniref:Mitochondrial carrier n=1 Tax=Trichodelitschia bisporula TaxID=703511 RepID=A0A6G1I2Y6_9PEZI|nr:mitochondrial carrier [Trichodelitschia bisporula]